MAQPWQAELSGADFFYIIKLSPSESVCEFLFQTNELLFFKQANEFQN